MEKAERQKERCKRLENSGEDLLEEPVVEIPKYDENAGTNLENVTAKKLILTKRKILRVVSGACESVERWSA